MRANLPAGSYGAPHTPPGWFARLASRTAQLSGKPATFVAAALTVVVWGVTGPIFNYSDTWQLVINTGTTIVTFLMVFLIQNTQTRDTMALHLKLDELIIATTGAKNSTATIEEASDEELDDAKEEVRRRTEPRSTRRRRRGHSK
jgi:low affinity Fe/Cu permease